MDTDLYDSIQTIAREALNAATSLAQRKWSVSDGHADERTSKSNFWIGYGARTPPPGFCDVCQLDVLIQCVRIQIGPGGILLPVKFVKVVAWPEPEYCHRRNELKEDYGGEIKDVLTDVTNWFQGCVFDDINDDTQNDMVVCVDLYMRDGAAFGWQ